MSFAWVPLAPLMAPAALDAEVARTTAIEWDSVAVDRPFVHHHGPADYRGQPEIWAAAQDRRGLLYFVDGGDDGILEFDGVSWRRVPAPAGARALGQDENGRVWVGAPSEMGYLDVRPTGETVFVSILDQAPEADRTARFEVAFFVPGPLGMAIVAEERLFLWRDGALQSWAAETERQYYRVFQFENALWAAQVGVGLVRLVDGSFEQVPGSERLADAEINFLAPAPQGGAWLITLDHGVFHLEDGVVRPVETDLNERLIALRVQYGEVLPNGDLALATLFGRLLVVAPDLTLRRDLDLRRGSSPEALYHAVVDQQGQLWVTGQEGVAHLDLASPIHVSGAREGVPNGLTGVRRAAGRTWLVGRSGVFTNDLGDERHAFKPIDGLNRESWDLLIDGESILVATRVGLYEHRSGQWHRRGSAASVRIAMLADNVLLVGQWGGVERFDRVRGVGWRSSGEVEGLDAPVAGPFVLAGADGVPEVWQITIDGRVVRARAPDGWDQAPTVEVVDTLTLADWVDVFVLDGDLAIASDHEVRRIARDRLGDADAEPFVSVPGLAWDAKPDAHVVGHQGPDGTFWLLHGDRLIAARRDEGGGFDLATAPSVVVPGQLHNLSLTTDAVDPDTLWLASHDRLLRIERPRAGLAPSRYEVALRGIEHVGQALGAIRSKSGMPSVPHARNEVRFAFGMPDYQPGPRPRYRVRLDGFDDDWSPWTEDTAKAYGNLSEGTYTFRVEAEGAPGPDVTYAFRVRPPWLRRWWAYLLYVAAGVASLLAFAGWRSRVLERDKADLENAVTLKTAELVREKEQVERQAGELSHVNRLLQEENDRRQALEMRMLQAQKLESLEVLAGGVAHDFNNLLTSILGNTDLAREAVKKGQPPERRLDDITEASRQAADLCEQMLAFSGKGRRKIADFDLSETTRGVRNLLSVSVPKMVEVHQHLPDGLPTCRGDVSQVRQVIMNLIVNAAEAVGPRPGRIDIETGVVDCEQRRLDQSAMPLAALAGRFVFLQVTDTGTGINPEHQARIFDPFFTTKLAGRGLGLAAVLGIVRGHGGAIEIDSRPGQGTTFRVLLPVDGIPLAAT